MKTIKPAQIVIEKDIYNEIFTCERCRCEFEANENDAFLLDKDGTLTRYESPHVMCPTENCNNVYPVYVSPQTFDKLIEKKYPSKTKQGIISWVVRFVLGLDQK